MLTWRGVYSEDLKSIYVHTDKDCGDHLALAQIRRELLQVGESDVGNSWVSQPVQPVLAKTESYSWGTSVCLSPSHLLWCDPGGFSVLPFSSLEETGVLEVLRRECCQSEFGKWTGSAQYLCSIISVRELPKYYKCFYSRPCCKFKSIGPSSLGIQSFQIRLYLPLIIINLQFSPWLIFRNVHNEKLLKKQEERKWKFGLYSVFLIYDLCVWNCITQWCILSPVFCVSSVTIETKYSDWYRRNGVSSSCQLVSE